MKSKVLEVGKEFKGEGKKKEKNERKGRGKRRKRRGKRKKEEVRERKGGERKKSLWDPNHNTLTYQIYHCNSLSTQNAMFHGFH